MRNVLTPARAAIASALLIGVAITAQGQTDFRRTLDQGEQATRRAGNIQQQINQLDDERSDLVGEFRTLIQRKQAADLFAAQQQAVVDSQLEEIASLEDQLGRVDEITAQMIPMMLDMITDLEQFVAADLPFKQDLRATRLENLRAAMENPQVPAPEAYRLIVEAYQAEMQYGSTIDTWEQTIDIDGNPVNVNMFQYGRLALVYLTQDQKSAARWDRNAGENGEWRPLPSGYNADIRQAIRIAQGKAPQTILPAPIQKLAIAE